MLLLLLLHAIVGGARGAPCPWHTLFHQPTVPALKACLQQCQSGTLAPPPAGQPLPVASLLQHSSAFPQVLQFASCAVERSHIPATRALLVEAASRKVGSLLAAVLRVVSHTPHRALRHVPIAGTVVTHLPVHDHSRWPFDVVVADIYDRLRVPLTATFTGEEVEKWYAEAGYADIEVTRRVRNTEGFVGRGAKR
jgi:hypothetical protein